MNLDYDPALDCPDFLATDFDFQAYLRRQNAIADDLAKKAATKAASEPAPAPAEPEPVVVPQLQLMPADPFPDLTSTETPQSCQAFSRGAVRSPKRRPLQRDEEVMLIIKERINGFLDSVSNDRSAGTITARREGVQRLRNNLSQFMYVAHILDGRLEQALAVRKSYDKRPDPEVDRDHLQYSKSFRERFGYEKIV